MSVYTKANNGPGKSNGVVMTKAGGQTIMKSFPPDNVHGLDLPNDRGGRSFGGSDTNLSHSLRGASAVQE